MATPDPLEGLAAMRLPPPPASSLVETLALAAACGALAALLVASLLGLFAAWRRRSAPSREALRALAASAGLPPGERAAAQAALLRRFARAHAGEDDGRLRDAAWLARLDALFATQFFTGGAGRLFGEALYRPLDGANVAAVEATLRDLLRRWRR